MADVVAHDVADEEGRQQDAHHGIDQEQPVAARHVEAGGEHRLDGMDEPLQHVGGDGGEHTDQKTEHQDKLSVGEALVQQVEQTARQSARRRCGPALVEVGRGDMIVG